ncbi:MAG: hypothetical protein HRT88_03735 [Lentisphaeraceae bacterium]|nr:hypothetical protein [Lentisphaeraceae bacterium]
MKESICLQLELNKVFCMNCRKAIVCCYIFFMSFLCAENDFYIRKFNAIEKEQLKVSVNYFQELVEESLFLRTETLRFAKDFEKLEKNDHVLSGKEIERIQIGIQDNLKLRNKLYSLIALYSNYEKFKTLERSLFDAKSRL